MKRQKTAVSQPPQKTIEAEKDQSNELEQVENGSAAHSPLASQLLQTQQTFGNRHAQQLVQTKLKLGAPNNKFEWEADRVAQQVTQNISHAGDAPTNSVQRSAQPTVTKAHPSSGAPLSPDVDAAIRQAQGQGRPFANPIRQQMENSFGTPFSNVHIHNNPQANQLSRSLNARAFTVGRDIFFRQGEYRPQQPAGQTLLAHELTHVLHQSDNTIQRKIGFEFETHQNARFEIGQDEATGDETKVFDHVKVGSTEYFDLEGDGSKIEIITKAVDDNQQGYTTLIQIMSNIFEFASALHKNRPSIGNLEGIAGFRLNLKEFDDLPIGVEKFRVIHNERDKKFYKVDDYYLNGNWGNGMVFNPHITVGVKLTTLDTLLVALTNMPRRGEKWPHFFVEDYAPKPIQAMANQLGWQQSKTGAGYQKALQLGHNAFKNLDKLNPPQELRGFLFLLGTFVGGHYMAETDDSLSKVWEKYKLPLMSRSHLGEIFSQFDAESKHWFEKNQKNIIKHLIAIQYPSHKLIKKDTPLFTTSKFKANNQVELTVTDMVTELLKNIDPIGSRFEARSVGEIKEANKKYNVKHAADIGQGRKGIIIELRRMGRNLAVDEITNYALYAHKLIQLVNQK